MSDNFILDFPVLQQDRTDFVEGVSYEIEASQIDGNLKIEHRLNGQSFIRQLVKNGGAAFSASLFYRDSSERQNHSCKADDIVMQDNEIVARQTIQSKFSYAPEITPSIIILKDKKISVNASSGLTDFWEQVKYFNIPKYSRIALGRKLTFTSSDGSKLMQRVLDENLSDGEMRVIVNENAGEGEIPVSLFCGKSVHSELRRITPAKPSNAVESMRSAIITQALCAVYAYMHNLDEDCEVCGALLAHLEMLKNKTEESWENENFDPSLAATKMQPYVINTKVLHGESDGA